MKRAEIEEKAFNVFQSGYCCSESILLTILERFAQSSSPELAKLASGFVGGLGKTHEDVCGALVGGIMALGYLYGRSEPGQNIQPLCDLVAEFRKKFIELHDSTNCKDILEKFGPQDNMLQCKRLTAEATGILTEILERKAQ